MSDQFANLPAALLGTLKREKKPFTYTPGGVNLSEVLNARLQKRIERKKKYREDHAFDPPKQVVVMSTYNSPLCMYSTENALEALELQAGLAASDNSATERPSTNQFGEPVQSKAFRVLQIITDTEDLSEKSPACEMRFTGIRDSKAIPSKFFHTLQKITGTEGEDEEEDYEEPRTGFQLPKQASSTPRPVHPPRQPSTAVPTLKRPAAFLPAGLSCALNGPLWKARNMADGTDF